MVFILYSVNPHIISTLTYEETENTEILSDVPVNTQPVIARTQTLVSGSRDHALNHDSQKARVIYYSLVYI